MERAGEVLLQVVIAVPTARLGWVLGRRRGEQLRRVAVLAGELKNATRR